MRNFKITFLLIALLGFYQSHAQTDALVYADSLTKATGVTYMNIFGTKVFIPKPGKNSAVKKNINVVEVFNDSLQVIAEISVLEYPAYAVMQLPGNGLTSFGIQGHTGKLLKKSGKEATILTFLCEDDEAKILIKISFIDVEREQYYLDILKNTRYDKKVKVNTKLLPLLARFTINAAGAGYQLTDVSNGAYRYAPNGVKPRSISEPQMWVTEHNSTDISELRYLDLPAVPAAVITDSVTKNVEEPTIDGFKVYTTVMYIGVAPNRLMVYQTARTNGIVSVVMTGIATSDFEKNKALFAQMANTLHARGTDEIKLFDK